MVRIELNGVKISYSFTIVGSEEGKFFYNS